MVLWKKLVFLVGLGMMFFIYQNCGDLEAIENGNREISSVISEVASDEAPDKFEITMAILQRLGVKANVDAPIVAEMQASIAQGDLKAAALRATEEPNFYNIAVRDFAAKMSNREELANVGLNDFIATFVGAARDDLDARELLYGDFYYWAPDIAEGVRVDESMDVVRSNNHFADLDSEEIDLAAHLVREDQQKLYQEGETPDLVAHDDAAGVITSRSFMLAHALAGTNRRLVEFSFSQFLCSTIEEWSDTSLPGFIIGRDIGRTPASLFNNKCKGCHAPMDAMRPAFAHVDFVAFNNGTGYVEYKKVTEFDPREDNFSRVDVPVPIEEQLVPSKFRRISSVYPDGHRVVDAGWENYTSDVFEWRTSKSGVGMKAYGQMIAQSHRFSQCMAKRVFKSICYQDLDFTKDELLVEKLAYSFEDSGYSLKNLFAETVIQQECLGVQQ